MIKQKTKEKTLLELNQWSISNQEHFFHQFFCNMLCPTYSHCLQPKSNSSSVHSSYSLECLVLQPKKTRKNSTLHGSFDLPTLRLTASRSTDWANEAIFFFLIMTLPCMQYFINTHSLSLQLLLNIEWLSLKK